MYDALAAYYDRFMSDVDYDAWINYLKDILGERVRGRDVGCGTGRFTIALKEAGYLVTGSDSSPEMLTVAAENARKKGVPVNFLLQPAEKLEDFSPLDFVIAQCDVVNYLKNPDIFFRKAYKALNASGVLTFDISSEYKLTEILGNNVFTETRDDVTYVWENFCHEKARRVDMRLTFFRKNENNYYSKSVETQTQYIHSSSDIEKRLRDAGFKNVQTRGFLKNVAPSEKEQRIHFIAYKQE